MVTKSGYFEKINEDCLSVLLELVTILDEFKKNIFLVGGSVPPLLIKDAPEKHTGSLDIDIVIDFEHVRKDAYEIILKKLEKKGYYQKRHNEPFSFFRDTKGGTVKIDLLASSDYTYEKVLGVRGFDLVFDTAVEISLSAQLPEGAEITSTIKVASIGPFLVTKGLALYDRKKDKDAYDIYWCCKNYHGGIDALAEVIKPILNNPLAREGVEKVKAKFKEIDLAPNWVANFLEKTEPEEREIIKREAFELVNTLLDKLGIEAFTE